jgi:chromosome segregation ATPase
MLLATGSAFDFVKFIQILCWIVLPVFLLAALLTVFLHYRKKKIEKTATANGDEEFIHASPELLGYTKGDGEYVFFDHSSLISEYKKRLFYNHARYTALHHDFEKLETKYAMLAQYASRIINNNQKNTNMENLHETMPQHVEKEINEMTAGYVTEKKELLARVEQLGKSYQSLQQEHESLLEKISMDAVTDEEKTAIINRWRKENIALKEKVAEQEYLKEIVEEKKIQIDFLQTQLEQRIKNNRKEENQLNQLMADLEQTRSENENTLRQLELLKIVLTRQQEESSKLQMVLNEKEELLAERQQLLASKLDHITWLENTLHEAKEQNELLNASAADSKDLVAAFQEQLLQEQLRTQSMEQKLSSNKQVLQRLYKDFSAIMGEESEQSPVIALRPEYVNNGNEEIAAQ